MLVLSRKAGQKIVIGKGIEITVCQIRRGQIRLGITAPREVPVHRKEIADGMELLEQVNLVRSGT